MSADAQPERFAVLTAEEILRTIFGDDFAGCNVSLDTIAKMIDDTIKLRVSQDKEWLEMYEKVVEAMYTLSTPPDVTKVTSSPELQQLLSTRLDAIHELTRKTIETAKRVKAERAGNAGLS